MKIWDPEKLNKLLAQLLILVPSIVNIPELGKPEFQNLHLLFRIVLNKITAIYFFIDFRGRGRKWERRVIRESKRERETYMWEEHQLVIRAHALIRNQTNDLSCTGHCSTNWATQSRASYLKGWNEAEKKWNVPFLFKIILCHCKHYFHYVEKLNFVNVVLK